METFSQSFAGRPWNFSRKSFGRVCALIPPALALATIFTAAASLHAQCPGQPSPPGMRIAQDITGNFTSPGRPDYDWFASPYTIDLSGYPAGGTLTIVVMVGSGPGSAIFFLLPPGTVKASDGGPSDSISQAAPTRARLIAHRIAAQR
jgi:hypothetical protein